MHVVEELPHPVREVEPVWIPMPDSTRLAARLWLPGGPQHAPAPAIFEYGPYRKRDGTRERDERMHRWFAGHGYACVRVDVRGSGDSEGVLRDEYTDDEQRDGAAIIAWIATQPWCVGTVGMIGKSWGGIAALQIAALRPPALRAVIAVCATDDRWATDAHWMGGCLLVENLAWGTMCMALAAQPPDPAIAGDAPEPAGAPYPGEPRWRAQWLQRLDAMSLLPAEWMRHATRDPYWRRGSVCEDYARIQCPVYVVSGWQDAYADSVPRLLAGLPGVRKGLVGPWAHVYPHEGTPYPAIGFLQEAKRWWDRHLRGIDTGIDAEPRYRAWMQEHPRARSARATQAREPEPFAPGRWVAEDTWPSPRIVERRLTLEPRQDFAGGDGHASEQTVGAAAGSWCAFGIEAEPFLEQSEDDARSLTFETPPLEAPLEIWGAPVIALDLEVDRAQAFVAVRLCDVAPDGDSARVSYALLDLAQRLGPERRDPVVPGERMRVQVELRHAAHSFAPGHRLRVAVSTAYWPITWPMPEPVRASVLGCNIDVPVRRSDPRDVALASFAPPECSATEEVGGSGAFTVVTHLYAEPDASTVVRATHIDLDADDEPVRTLFPAIDFESGHGISEIVRIAPHDPLAADVEFLHRIVQRRGEWEARVDLRVRARAGPDDFDIEASVTAEENGTRVRARQWREQVPRPRPTTT